MEEPRPRRERTRAQTMTIPTPYILPHLTGVCALAAALLVPAPASWGEPGLEPVPPPGFVETIDVRTVDVEAVVTHKGERVEGLTVDDFRLLVDGEPTPIEFFSEVRSGRLTPGSPSPTSSPTNPSAKGLGANSDTVVPTYFLVFIDDYFSLPSQRNQMLRHLERQLDEMRPEDRMAIVAYDGKVVEMLSNWSNAGRGLTAGLRRASERPAYGLQRRSEWQQALSRLRYQSTRVPGSSFTSIGFSGSTSPALDHGQTLVLETEISAKISRVADAAASSLRAFAGPQGRRVMLLLSGGMPGLGSYGLPNRQGLFNSLDHHIADRDARRLLSPIVEASNLLGYTVYPVDLGSSRTFGGAEVGSLRQAHALRRQAQEDEFLAEGSLYYLADETGGRPFFRGARQQALKKVVEDARSFYSIGFTPQWQADDRPRSITVEVLRKGHKVRTRRGFADLSRPTLMSFQVESAHQFDVPLPNAQPLSVELGEPEPAGIGKTHVPVTVRIPLDNLALLPTSQGLTANLELRIAASDDRGRRADIGVIPIELAFADAGEVGKTAVWQTTLKLRKRDHRLLLALYDPIGDALLARRVELDL